MKFSGLFRYDMGNNLEHFEDDAFNLLNAVFFSIFAVCVCFKHCGITGGLILIKCSGYGHKKELVRLFHT